MHHSSSLYNKKINFKKKVVSDVTLETTFSLNQFFEEKRRNKRKIRGAFLTFIHAG
jgi:hypothetical protein